MKTWKSDQFDILFLRENHQDVMRCNGVPFRAKVNAKVNSSLKSFVHNFNYIVVHNLK